MRVLRKGLKGPDVKKWQLFLHGHPSKKFIFASLRDGIFGPETDKHTRAFQTANHLVADGVVGNATYAAAMAQGLEVVDFLAEPEAKFPAEPSFGPIVGTAGRQQVFGPLKYKAGGNANGKESLIITNNFESDKIVTVQSPELAGITGASASGKVRFHRAAAAQFAGLWTAWGRRKLLKHVLRWDGSFVPRFIRCSTSSLSNHAFGTAFDINAKQNALGAEPALPGKPGCVFELVPIAHEFGFYWGGHFKNRRDGMHFEVAKILSDAQVAAALAKF